MSVVSIVAPPSKSLSHRALIAAGLASGVSRLDNILESDDTRITRAIMTALGARYDQSGPGAYTVTGMGKVLPGGGTPEEPLSLFVGESGTTCRLITALAASGTGSFRIHGAGRMHERPLGDLVAALRCLGTEIRFEGLENCPPLILTAANRAAPADTGEPARIAIGCDESSQYLSGLLMAAPLRRTPLSIALGGTKAVSWPYVGLTLSVLERFGIRFSVLTATNGSWQETDWRGLQEAVPGKVRFDVVPGEYATTDYTVEGDWSGASYFLAAGAIGPRPVRVEGLYADSLQGDAAILDILHLMGARIETGSASVTVYPSELAGVSVDMGHCPDLVPTVAALAAHASGETRIYGVAHLSIKESDRIAAPAAELSRAGCSVRVATDGLCVSPPAHGLRPPAEGGVFSAHNDHRIAMSTALLGLPDRKGAGFTVRLDNPGCVAKSFPSFWQLWEQVQAKG